MVVVGESRHIPGNLCHQAPLNLGESLGKGSFLGPSRNNTDIHFLVLLKDPLGGMRTSWGEAPQC